MAIPALDGYVATLDDQVGTLALGLRSGSNLGVALALVEPRWSLGPILLDGPGSVGRGSTVMCGFLGIGRGVPTPPPVRRRCRQSAAGVIRDAGRAHAEPPRRKGASLWRRTGCPLTPLSATFETDYWHARCHERTQDSVDGMRRNIVMLTPRAWALKREEAVVILEVLLVALHQPR